MNSISEIKKYLHKKQGEKEGKIKDIESAQENCSLLRKKTRQHEQALEIVKEVGLKTQQQIQYHISDLTTMALESVLNEPYKLGVEFVERRNKTECDLYFLQDEDKIDPLSASGGGVVDIAAFALRITSWVLQAPRTRNTIILDEPLRFVSADLQEKASILLKEISKKLNLQFIIVTHNEILASYADKKFYVSQIKKISRIEEV